MAYDRNDPLEMLKEEAREEVRDSVRAILHVLRIAQVQTDNHSMVETAIALAHGALRTED